MEKDLSKVIEQYVYTHLSHRDDILVQVVKSPTRYKVHIFIYVKPTDGLYATINKGIDRGDLMNGIKGYFNLDWDSCMIYTQVSEYQTK
jgi:hypothetical protein